MSAYTADTILSAITIDSTNNIFVVTEDPGGVPAFIVCTVDAGTYFLHDDSSFHATKKGLLYTLKTLINDGTTAGLGTVTGTSANTYTWAASTPTSSTGLTNNGVELRSTTITDYEVTWTGSATMDAQIFGAILSSPAADDASATDGGDEVVSWPHATKYRMCTRDMLDGYAVDKIRHRYKDVRYSSTRPSDSVAVVWDSGYFRVLRYEDVFATDVHPTRSNESAFAALTTRHATDEKATWFDVWDGLTDGGEALIVHNSTSDLQVDTHSYETVKLWQPLQWDAFAEQITPAGDYYAVTLPVWVDESASDYDH